MREQMSDRGGSEGFEVIRECLVTEFGRTDEEEWI